jgi:hypothetical protein
MPPDKSFFSKPKGYFKNLNKKYFAATLVLITTLISVPIGLLIYKNKLQLTPPH